MPSEGSPGLTCPCAVSQEAWAAWLLGHPALEMGCWGGILHPSELAPVSPVCSGPGAGWKPVLAACFSLPRGSSSALQAGPRLGPLHPLPGPDKAPRLEVPILWQQGQMAGTKLIPALRSSVVLWPGRALGKRCRGRTLPTATRRVLPEDTTRHGSGWKQKPGRGSGDN